MYDLAMALLNSEVGYVGFQYLAIGTGDGAWDNLSKPPEAPPDAPHLYPYTSPAQIQRLKFLYAPTGGTFQLGFNGVNTSILTFDPNASGTVKAAIMQVALEAISTIGSGNINVLAEGGDSYLVTFAGNLNSGPQPLITAITTGLTGSNSPTIIVVAVNNPLDNVIGEFIRFPIDSYVYLNENGVPLDTGISRYVKLSVTIPSGSMTPINSAASPIVFREMAWVGGKDASLTIGTGMYLNIIRFPKEIRRFGDGAITLSSSLKI
jgi:hypothetical protein